MATPYRGYTELPGAVTPDVPYRVNLALREIDADVHDAVAELEAADATQNGRLATLEAAAGFGQGMDLQDDAVNGLLNNAESLTAKTVNQKIDTRGPAAVLSGLATEGNAVRTAFDKYTRAEIDDMFPGPLSRWRAALEGHKTRAAVWVSLGSSTAGGGTTRFVPQQWVHRVAAWLTQRNLVQTPNAVVTLDGVSARPANGIHAYQGAVGGTTSSNYLTAAKVNEIKALAPDLVTHMVGSNDFGSQVALSTYKTNLRNWMDKLNAASPATVHMFIHQQPRNDLTAPKITWAQYGQAMREVAELYPNVVFLDASLYFPRNSMPGHIMAEAIHMNEYGHKILADVVSRAMGTPIVYAPTEIHRVTVTGQDTPSTLPESARFAFYKVPAAPYPREITLEVAIYAYGKGAAGAMGPEMAVGVWYDEAGTVKAGTNQQMRILNGGVGYAQPYNVTPTYFIDPNREVWVVGHCGGNVYISGNEGYSRIRARTEIA